MAAASLRERLRVPAWLAFCVLSVCTVVWIGPLDDIPAGVVFFLGLSAAFALLLELGWTIKLYTREIYSWDANRAMSKKTPLSINVAIILYLSVTIFVLRSFLLSRPLEPLDARYALLALGALLGALVYTAARKVRVE
ncbi:hypothetical protein ABMA32_17550 [Mesorhizobium sp. VNQ89]|uniref:hypothetical protein n=1 Tax=Mesorhizobium quangtriensis TaxID=3157709 RepID=UPI0032B74699